MSGYLPVGTSLQLSTIEGSIYHKKILASNVEGTPTLSSFPTTSTGLTKGSYEFHDGVSKHLNASGASPSGHEFYTSSSTSAPVLNLTVNNDSILTDTNFTVDKSSPGVLSPNVLFLDPDGRTINFPAGTDLTQSPYNMSQQFNPIYMLQTTSLYTTGTLCYAILANNESLQIFNNDENTNPIPPNVVPSDFGNSSNVGITIGQPLFSIGGSGSIQKAIVTEVFETQFETNHAVLAPAILSFYDDNLSSSFSLTDIIFDGVSYKEKIDNQETEINNNKILSINSFNIYNSSAIYADGKPPLAIPSTIQNIYAYPGWYYKNTVSGKINWYLPSKSSTFQVSQLLGFYLNLFNLSTTSNDNTLFLTVYTKVDSITPNYTNWYKSRNTYVITDTPTINTSYTFFANASGSCPSPNIYASTLLEMSPSTVSNPKGNYAQNEEVLFFSIGTNSASPVNSVEFVLRSFGVMTVDGSTEFVFQNLL